MKVSIFRAVVSMAASIILTGPALAQSDDAAAGALVAAQVRQQDFACDDPATAVREPNSDDDAVWILTCGNASYRVRLVPDEAAHVEKLN